VQQNEAMKKTFGNQPQRQGERHLVHKFCPQSNIE
jgi:hypothetical protein